MPERRPLVVSFVERGWQAARECSLDPQLQEVECLHIIKGWVPRAVREMIGPAPRVQLVCVPRRLFWCVVWSLLPGLWLLGRLRALLVDNDRSHNRLRGWQWRGVHVAKVLPGSSGYELWDGCRAIPRPVWSQMVTA